MNLARERARRKAEFCLAAQMAPSEYERLTLEEHNEFIKILNKRK